jgi:hypothetical protein
LQPGPHERVSQQRAWTSPASIPIGIFRPEGSLTVKFTGTANM